MRVLHATAYCIVVFGALTFMSCASRSQVRLQKGLSYDAFRNLGPIDRADATLAVVLPEELLASTVERKVGNIEYNIDLGDTIASKLIQLLAYKFERVVPLESERSEAPIPWDLQMRVELKNVELDLDKQSGWSAYTMVSTGFLSLEARIVNRSGEIVWVGTSEAEGQGESASGAYEVSDIEGGLSRAIDVAIADIASQLSRSEALRAALREVSVP